MPLAGQLSLATPGSPSSATLGANGGTVNATGLTLTVPAGALAGDTPFAVTATAITGFANAGDYGGALTPLTPLFTVADDEADLSAPVTVTLDAPLSADAPAGTTPMAFYYDRDSGVLSPLSPLGYKDGKLTALATHFSDILGMVVDWTKVPDVVDSGFRPGVDDWQFDNYGSYIAPGGQCEGQALSEIWYYNMQRKAAGAAPLYGVYDNNGATVKTPELWQDDSSGYRFVASVHADPIVDRATYLALRNPQWAAADNRQTYDAFRAAIALSGSPQMIRISTDGVSGGHTMVIYRASAGRLYVADPNYVGRLRTIVYDAPSGKLSPYRSGDSATSIAADGGTSYAHFAYVPVLAARTDASIAARWAEFETNQAGDTVFPSYTLYAATDQDAAGKDVWEPLADGFTTDQATLKIQVSRLLDNSATSMAVFRDTDTITTGDWGWKQTLALEPGDNNFGLLVYGQKGEEWAYVDFVRLTIVNTEPVAGRWVRTRSEAENGPWSKSFSEAGETLDFNFSDGSASVAYNYDGPPNRNETGSASWGSPPASGAPGDTWTTTLATKGRCKGDLDLFWTFRVTVGITWNDEYGENASQNAAAAATCATGAGTAELSWTFPPAPVITGSSVKIYVNAGDPHGSDTWFYEYTWQE